MFYKNNIQKLTVRSFLTSALILLVVSGAWSQTATITTSSPKGCAPHTATLSATNPTAPINSYNWSTSDGQVSTQANPVFGWVTPGTYTVTLKINGSSQSTTFTVQVWKNPLANFTANDTTICKGSSVNFANTTTQGDAAINTWLWDFGNGQSGNTQNPSAAYPTAGTYTVTLTATDANGCMGKKIKSQHIIVTNPPTVSITNTPANLISCTAPLSVDFNSSTSGGTLPYSYSWSFGNGQNSAQADPPATSYTAYQNYTATLTVTDGNGCIVTNTKTISISQFQAGISVVGKDTICKGSSATFQDQSTATANAWNWSFGNGNTSAVKNPPAQTYPTPGTYTIQLIASNAQQCRDTVKKKIVVLDNDVFTFKADTTKSCTAPFKPTFTVTPATPGATYSWNFGSAGTGTGASTIGNFNEGTYSVSCTMTNAYGCQTTITKNNYITVSLPKADFTADTLKGCKPLYVDFTSNSTVGYNGNNGNNATYSWSFANATGGTTSSTQQNPAHVYYPDSGSFNVTLTVTNALGCSATKTKTNYIQPGLKPTPKFVADPLIGCHPLKVKFTDSSSTWVDEWKWDFGGVGNSTQQNPSFTYDVWFPTGPRDTGYFNITLIVGHHECYDTLKVDSMIYVNGPSPNFHIYNEGVKDDNIACNYNSHWFMFKDTSLTQRATSTYYWNFGDPTSGAANLSGNKDTVWHYYANPGKYKVQLIVYDAGTGCRDTVSKDVIVSDFHASIATPPNPCVLITTAQFTGTAIDNANNNGASINSQDWKWDFGDNSTGTSTTGTTSQVTHVYNNPSENIPIKLVATNSLGCKDTVIKTIKAKALPTANFSMLPTQGCAPVVVNFTDSSSTPSTNGYITNWSWTLGNGNTSTSQSPQNIVYTGAGVKTVSLFVTDSAGCKSSTVSKTITVNDPQALFTISASDSTVCNGSPLTFNAQSSVPATGLEYSWNFGNGQTQAYSTTNSVSQTYNVNATTQYTVTLTVKDNLGCTSTKSKQIIVSKPKAGFFINNPIADCAPITFHLNNTTSSSDVTSINYLFGDGTSLTQAYTDSVTHTYQSPGLYDIRLIVTNQKGCTDTLYRNHYVSVGGPVASYDYSPKNGCPPLTVTFTTSAVSNVSSYQFVFTDGGDTTIHVNSNTITFTHTFTNSGSFNPIMIIKDTLNTTINDSIYCTRSLQLGQPIVVSGPIVGFTVDTTFHCAMGTPFQFKDTTKTNGSTPTGVLWTFGDGQTKSLTVPQTTVPHSYNGVGYFDVSLTYYSAPNCTSTIVKPAYLSVFQGPNINLDITGSGCPPYGKQFSADTASAGSSGIYAQSILWNFDDGTTSTIEDPYHFYPTKGSYSPGLTIHFSNGCNYTYQNTGSIVVYDEPTANFTEEPVFDEFNVTGYNFVDSSLNAVTWNWNFGDNTGSTQQNPQHLYGYEGDYPVQLIVTNQYGCLDTLIKTLKFKQNVYIPNILSLDGKDENQVFNVRLPEVKQCMRLQVYDRWGNIRYENDNYKNDWKGTDKTGKRLPVDTYYYILNFCDKLTYNGWVYIHYNSGK